MVLSFAQMEGKCYCCGKPGHKSPDCNKKDKIPKDEWAIKKSQHQFVQEVRSQTNESPARTSEGKNNETKNEPLVGWTGLHHSFLQSDSLKESVIVAIDYNASNGTYKL